MLALTLSAGAGWSTQRQAACLQPWERLAIICGVMMVFAFTSFVYALVGAAAPVAGAGRHLLWFNRAPGAPCWCSRRTGCSPYDRWKKKPCSGAWSASRCFAATFAHDALAVGSTDAPQLSPWFVTFGRCRRGPAAVDWHRLLWQRTHKGA